VAEEHDVWNRMAPQGAWKVVEMMVKSLSSVTETVAIAVVEPGKGCTPFA
jgi:hypothetical protein